jgi:hypothetical protein
VNNHPLGENLPNLVTLAAANTVGKQPMFEAGLPDGLFSN